MHLAEFVNGSAFTPEDFGDSGIPVVRIKQLLNESSELELASVPPRPVWLQDGDLVFSWSATLAVRSWNRGRALLNQHLFRVDVHPGIERRWFAYVLEEGTRRLEPLMHGSAMTHITREMLKSLSIVVPPLTIQRAIADYLDHETARIDALMTAKQRMAGLLDEQLQSYVDRAIRDQARSNGNTMLTVIGDVPDDWGVMHLRRVASIYSGTTFPHDYQGRSAGDYPLYKVADFASPGNEIFLYNCENWISSEDLSNLRGRIIPTGSIIFPRVGAALLLNARRILTRPSLLDDNSRALHFMRGDVRYWRYVMTLVDFGRLANPGAVPTIGEEAILSLKVPVPSDVIQRHIADAIDGYSRHCEKLRDANARQISLLRERRQALITAIVTGELHVPETA